MPNETTERLRNIIQRRRYFDKRRDIRSGGSTIIIALSDGEQILKDRDNMEAEIKKLNFMIDNGLGWDDMKNDISPMHEL